jgi:lipopolysaccharide/colanic/teichoic acid biosynthesis glycosyltransferase
MAKRLVDIFASVCGILALSSFFLVLSLAIKQEDGGPVFYRGERIGQNGVPFRIFKFRSMVMNAEKIGGSSTADDDPRITKIGHKLRKLKRPGITDWASLWNPDEGIILAGSPDPEKTYMEKIRPTKLELQLKYVREKSLRNDLVIILQTLKTVVSR